MLYVVPACSTSWRGDDIPFFTRPRRPTPTMSMTAPYSLLLFLGLEGYRDHGDDVVSREESSIDFGVGAVLEWRLERELAPSFTSTPTGDDCSPLTALPIVHPHKDTDDGDDCFLPMALAWTRHVSRPWGCHVQEKSSMRSSQCGSMKGGRRWTLL